MFPEHANAAKNNQQRPQKQGGSSLYSYFLNHRGQDTARNLSIAGERRACVCIYTDQIREKRTDSTFGIWPPCTADIYNPAA